MTRIQWFYKILFNLEYYFSGSQLYFKLKKQYIFRWFTFPCQNVSILMRRILEIYVSLLLSIKVFSLWCTRVYWRISGMHLVYVMKLKFEISLKFQLYKSLLFNSVLHWYGYFDWLKHLGDIQRGRKGNKFRVLISMGSKVTYFQLETI